MARARELWERAAGEPWARWAALAAVPVLWLALAWRDPRLLLALPLLAAVPFVAARVRGERDDDLVL
ncbi:MAG TPA: hypothetical protein VM290_02810 [Gaiellaceae bacterium]|nr:hypothetical protein [Gaiellaceae bacterium]